MLRVLVRPPESEVSTLLLFIVREMGGLFLMFGVLLFLASRDPVRNVAIILFGRSTFAHSILRTSSGDAPSYRLAIPQRNPLGGNIGGWHIRICFDLPKVSN